MKKLSRLLLPVVLALMIGASLGCAAKGAGRQHLTYFEKVLAWNAALADSNDSIAKGIIAANRASFVGLETARRVTELQFAIAGSDKKITEILGNGQEYSKLHAAELKDLLGDVQAKAGELVKAGLIGVKNPNSQEDLNALAGALVTLANEMIDGLKNSGVIQ